MRTVNGGPFPKKNVQIVLAFLATFDVTVWNTPFVPLRKPLIFKGDVSETHPRSPAGNHFCSNFS